VHVGDELSIAFADLDTPARLRDLSFGGFSIETPVPIPIGEPCRFLISVDAQLPLVVTAIAMHCRQVPGDMRYVSGWAAETGEGKRALADAVTSLSERLMFDV
jgi:hypothetical protein